MSIYREWERKHVFELFISRIRACYTGRSGSYKTYNEIGTTGKLEVNYVASVCWANIMYVGEIN